MRSVLAVVLLLSVRAIAAPAFSVESFRPAVDSQGLVTLNAAQTLPHLGWSVGLVGDYAFDPLVLRTPGAQDRVEHLVTMQLQAAVGLLGGERFHLHGFAMQLGVTLPVHVLVGTTLDGHFSEQSVGDLGINAKLRFVEDARRHVGVGLVLALDLPTDRGATLLGEGQVTFRPSLVVDKTIGRVQLVGNVGALVRGRHEWIGPTTLIERTTGTALTYGVGLAVAIVRQRLSLVGEVYGSHDFFAGKAGTPLEAALAAKVYLATSSYFEIGAGAGLLPRHIADGSTMTGQPTARAFVGFVFEPRLGGRSKGALEDSEPPRRPQPAPPPIADDDHEPEAPEIDTSVPIPDEPPHPRVVRAGGVFKTFEKVYFKTASAEILPRSFPLLDDVAKLLVDNPDVRLLEIAGHADERGDDGYNLRLTEARAKSVRTYLIDKGTDAARLSAHGYGETQPAEDPQTQSPCVAHTAYCWDKNRRVEFRILDPK